MKRVDMTNTTTRAIAAGLWDRAYARYERSRASEGEAALREARRVADFLVVLPAADLRAVARKIEMAVHLDWSACRLQPVLSDLRRLAA